MGKRGKKPQDYALYAGDEFIDLGTISEISKRTGYRERYLRQLNCPTKKGLSNLILIRLDQGEER